MSTRHESLIPLTHDHHHALAQARRLKHAEASGDAAVALRPRTISSTSISAAPAIISTRRRSCSSRCWWIVKRRGR